MQRVVLHGYELPIYRSGDQTGADCGVRTRIFVDADPQTF